MDKLYLYEDRYLILCAADDSGYRLSAVAHRRYVNDALFHIPFLVLAPLFLKVHKFAPLSLVIVLIILQYVDFMLKI